MRRRMGKEAGSGLSVSSADPLRERSPRQKTGGGGGEVYMEEKEADEEEEEDDPGLARLGHRA